MNRQEKIKLGEFQNVDGVNVDNSLKLYFDSSKKQLLEYDIQNVLDVTQVFDDERQNTDTYRIHGEVEYLSILNNIVTGYTGITDFFSLPALSATTKNVLNDFKFYIVKPLSPSGTTLNDGISTSTGYTEFIVDERYRRDYEVLTELIDFEIYKAGYSTNVYEEQQYAFSIAKDIDVINDVDGLNFPLTELYVYAEYQPNINGLGDPETISKKVYNSTGGTDSYASFTAVTLNVGDIIEGDIVNYSKNTFEQSDFNLMEYRINTPYSTLALSLEWEYNPFIPITIRVFSDDLQRVNTGSTSVEDVDQVPVYATSVDTEGNVVWRDLLDKGFFDPLTEEGVNYPFINNKHYIFENVIVSVQPNLDDSNTAAVFDEIKFAANEFVSSEPSSSLTNINEKCDL